MKQVISALRSRDFRLLWLSQSISVIGDGLVVVAVGLFVTRLTGNPSDVGLVLTAYVLPLVLLLLLGGVIADRLPRQAVMVVSDCARCVLHGTLALLIALRRGADLADGRHRPALRLGAGVLPAGVHRV